ncbi:cystathionine gamma-synthase [Colletotrichum graminicola]|uniref:cystathionine gamma-synthase n=1 Tax=Colletotrichum graminicola (strain M1.001 / M2 / FGSC 10212) TaxID=645133 RepID=E3QGZ7_COLGM|nr:cystathionine gamma-synthase [Colletotrichum graminicola M1.001]EFQ30135.1 cystathionine gamma-synthase [Colletotrichum graminicola M1.001]WDK09668.1 cystathionine gamma-synthase [Colletotrichum graminicola]
MPQVALGESIPPDTAHAVSVSLPTWKSNVGYEEGESWVVDKMTTGYPRFFIHKSIEAFARVVASTFARTPGQRAMLFPDKAIAQRCIDFLHAHAPAQVLDGLDTVHLVLDVSNPEADSLKLISPTVSGVLFHPDAFPYAKQFWQHSGDGVSSRRAEFCHGLLAQGLLCPDDPSRKPTCQVPQKTKGPRRYQRPVLAEGTAAAAAASHTPGGSGDTSPNLSSAASNWFVEERFGRNLDISFVDRAKAAIKRRIAGTLSHNVDVASRPLPEADPSGRGIASLTEHDVYLFPTGMSAIFNTHRFLLSARGSMKSISFGFPYVDTLKILQKFGPGCVFYGRASEQELDELQQRLESGERFLALFCEFPGNPMLTCPNLKRIRSLADQYDFALVVDETIGTFGNIDVLQYADVVVSSLTKIFSGDCNVMGGSAVLNPKSRYYASLKTTLEQNYSDTYWPEDAIFMERNSRDFAKRISRINTNAEAVAELLLAHPLVKRVHYPKHNADRANYEDCRLPSGGYGGLMSAVFHRKEDAMVFYDNMESPKGPSLGTNFTLTSPYVLLAHYGELDWAVSLGVDPNLLRISVGLEETDRLTQIFSKALEAAEKASQGAGSES